MFEGKVIIITGGSSGIGKELAFRLVKQGASLALIARDREKLDSVKIELQKAGPEIKIEIYSCDVSDMASVEKTFAAIAEDLGSPDVLINSAGIISEGYFENQSLETFHDIMDINYFGTLHCIKAVLPYFKKSGGGRIINLSSLGGKIGSFGYAAYCSSKFAVTGLTEALRSELKPQKIIFHMVCPPEFEGPMVDGITEGRTEENRQIVHTVPVLSVEKVADEIMDGLRRNQYLIIPGRVSRLVDTAGRWFPALSRMVVDGKIKHFYKGPDA